MIFDFDGLILDTEWPAYVSAADEYVWAVIDVNSQYAAGGQAAAALPLLGPASLVALGGALLGAAALGRRRRAAR